MSKHNTRFLQGLSLARQRRIPYAQARRCLATTAVGGIEPRPLLSLGIRREDKNHWERRVPLTPDHVEKLTKEVGARVYVQPSSKRVFPDQKYEQAGALVQEDLSPADVIIGVKEVPLDKLIEDKTYLFFSHTHKGQKYNMPLLKTILDKPLMRYCKNEKEWWMVFTDSVSDCLLWVTELHSWLKIVHFAAWSPQKVYACQVKPSDYLVHKDGKPYDREHYHAHPEEYASNFHEKIAPYATMLINGIFWNERYPRLITKAQAKQLALEDRLRLLSIADISCDINGSLEFMSHSSTINHPFYMYDPITESTHNSIEGRGVQIMSIDNLPTELPLEASEYFSNALTPYVTQLVKGNVNHPVLDRATITTEKGALADRHQKLYDAISKHGQGAKVFKNSRALVLGSGFVAAPLVDYLLRSKHHSVTIASNSLPEARTLAGGRKNATVAELSVTDKEQLRHLVGQHDVVVSFVPATLHPVVAEACLDARKNMVTASYISPALAALDARAQSSNITIMNEIGLDPGIDHMTAMKLFDHVRSKGGRIKSFVSWCGGLPAPEASDNPLGYKFSWSPKGVLLAGLNSARYKLDGKMVDIPGERLLKSAMDVNIYKGFALEGVPNRDSLKYLDFYGLGPVDGMDSMFRGTLRYKGYAELMAAFNDLGLLSTTTRSDLESGMPWANVMASLLGTSTNYRAAVASKLGLSESDAKVGRVMSTLQWLGMFSETAKAASSTTVLDAFCALLQKQLVYAPGERDMVAMHHIFGIEWADGSKEKRTSTLVAYGDPTGYSAMAKTVGLPAAIGTEMLLNGQITRKGVIAPTTKDIYEPILEKLEKEGVRFIEAISREA
ncbi:hypothetical protein HK104_002890 [Borealophlyctis nickersoniae]|nr:hypothetical protein HK104_002890 [Borealophlyctis nickersoniae]